MQRREFLSSSALAAASLTLTGPLAAAEPRKRRGDPFRLDYAPHFGMFSHHAGDDFVAQLEFIAAEGFRSLEDNGMAGKSVEDQERIAKAMERLDLRMGVFVAHADFRNVTFASNKPDMRERIVADAKKAVEVAKRVNAKWCTVVPGCFSPGDEPAYQTAAVIDNLRRAAEVMEPSGLVMVLEPLNPWRDHAGLFLTKVPQAYEICRAVQSPSCKILDDLYHQQITEGNLTGNIDRAWDEIAYFQVGDHPGRHEPTTGEINYKNVFRHIHGKGFDGIVGMEHGNSMQGREGERAVIEAYRECDAFE